MLVMQLMQVMPNNKEKYHMMPAVINVIKLYISLEFLLMKGKQKFPLTNNFPAPALLSSAFPCSTHHSFCWATTFTPIRQLLITGP